MPDKPITLWWIHGTLQQSVSWAPVLQANPDLQELADCRCISVADLPATSLTDWADNFNRVVASAGTNNNLAIGYSLGGRLALHAALQAPKIWNGVVCVAGHPGPRDAHEASTMEASDRAWRQRLRDDGPTVFLQRWNAAALFGHSIASPGQQQPDARLVDLYWGTLSKARQADLRTALAKRQPCDILYVSGTADPKYSNLGAELAQQFSRLQAISIADAGHRVPWDQPEHFGRVITAWIQERI